MGTDKTWSGLHADEVQQMLNESNSMQTRYTILKHRFGRGRNNEDTLYRIVKDNWMGDILEITPMMLR